MHVTGVFLMGAYFMSAYLMGVCLMGAHLIGAYLMSVCLMRVSHRCVCRCTLRASPRSARVRVRRITVPGKEARRTEVGKVVTQEACKVKEGVK
jgi:hypothetical protein